MDDDVDSAVALAELVSSAVASAAELSCAKARASEVLDALAEEAEVPIDTDLEMLLLLSLIHISEPTRPY